MTNFSSGVECMQLAKVYGHHAETEDPNGSMLHPPSRVSNTVKHICTDTVATKQK